MNIINLENSYNFIQSKRTNSLEWLLELLYEFMTFSSSSENNIWENYTQLHLHVYTDLTTLSLRP
jgi:hypothetical protein